MAFKNCFYVKRIDPDATRSLALSIAAEDVERFSLDWQYGYEKPDGSEPDWRSMVLVEGNYRIPLPADTRTYLKGNTSMALRYETETLPSAHGINLIGDSGAFASGLEIGGSPQSLVWDGDGDKRAVKLHASGAAYVMADMLKDMSILPVYTQNLILLPINYPAYYQYFLAKSENLQNLPTTLIQSTDPAESQYESMLANTNILVAPKDFLKATKLNSKRCYYKLFANCSNLEEIWVNFTEWPAADLEATTDWVADIAPIGTFYCPESLPQIFDTSHIPNGWAVITFPDPKQPSRPFKIAFKKNYVSGGRRKA